MWHVAHRPYYELIWDTFSLVDHQILITLLCAHRILSHPMFVWWCLRILGSLYAACGCLLLFFFVLCVSVWVSILNYRWISFFVWMQCVYLWNKFLPLASFVAMLIKDNKNGIYDDLGFCWNAFELMRSKVAFYSNCLGVCNGFLCATTVHHFVRLALFPFWFLFLFIIGFIYLYSESNVLFLPFSLADTVLHCKIWFSHHNSSHHASQKREPKLLW